MRIASPCASGSLAAGDEAGFLAVPRNPGGMTFVDPQAEPLSRGIRQAKDRNMRANLLFGCFALLVAIGAGAPSDANAAVGVVPQFAVEATCRAAAQRLGGMGNGSLADADACIRDEHAAKQQLAKSWSGFSPSAKASCVPLSNLGGKPTYTELLTCLELSQQARQYEQQQASTAGHQR
jgi:hypothetical protein